MAASSSTRAVAARTNLRRAWLWTRTNPDPLYKLYFRNIYKAYALQADEGLAGIRDRLITNTFLPSTATKVYVPKASGVLRPVTLLGVEDQIVYQALTNIIAERLVRRVGARYHRIIFGHIYAGRDSLFFYKNWRYSYRLFTAAMRRAYRAGYRYTASFDLTACYDTIDHAVLTHFLRNLGLDEELCTDLCYLLTHWTDAIGGQKPVYHGHGIPQGPLPSGLLAECVLRHFDDARRPRRVRYFRYVDDIRLFAKDEDALRLELVKLDIRSKEVGLFPQASKIDIHYVKNIDDEFKGISHPPELAVRGNSPDQNKVRKRLTELSPRHRVTNTTRFKYVLGSAQPDAQTALRLLRIVRRQPHLYSAIFRYLDRCPRLSRKVSRDCVELLNEFDLYPAFTAALIRATRASIHPDYRKELQKYCRSRISGSGRRAVRDPELRAVAASVLLRDGVATWPQTEFNVCWAGNWWVRAELITHVSATLTGGPAMEYLCDRLLRDESPDVSLVAADVLIRNKLYLRRPLKGIHVSAQHALKNAGIIGRVIPSSCPIGSATATVLDPKLRRIRWREVFGPKAYRPMIKRFAVWRAYFTTDATAWVVLTDTINDSILHSLFRHDGAIGSYTLGSIGAVLQPSSAFAKKYPTMFTAALTFHELRLEADLAHVVTRRTNRPTRRIRFRELPKLCRLLASGFQDMWSLW